MTCCSFPSLATVRVEDRSTTPHLLLSLLLERDLAAHRDTVDDRHHGTVGAGVPARLMDASGTAVGDNHHFVFSGADKVDGQVRTVRWHREVRVARFQVLDHEDREAVQTRLLDRGDHLPQDSGQLHGFAFLPGSMGTRSRPRYG